jgi:hypothetical protein
LSSLPRHHWSKAKSVVKSGQVIVEPVETLAVVLVFGQRFGWRKAAQQSILRNGFSQNFPRIYAFCVTQAPCP